MKTILLSLTVLALLLLLQGCRKEAAPQNTDEIPAIANKRANAHEMSGTLPTGTYIFITAATYYSSKQVLSVKDSSTSTGAKMEQRAYSTNTGQEWIVTALGNNEYSLVNNTTGKALRVSGIPAVGMEVDQASPDASNPAQRWLIAFRKQGVYQIMPKLKPNLSLNVEADGIQAGTKIYLDTPVGIRSAFVACRTGYTDLVANNFFKRRSGWVSGDGGYSIPLQDNQVLWTFGDSFLDTYNPANNTVPCLFSVHNALVGQSKGNWNPELAPTLIDRSTTDRTPFKVPGTKWFFWPGSGVQIHDTVYIVCAGLEPSTDPDAWLGTKPLKNMYMFKVVQSQLKLAGYKRIDPEVGKFDFGIGFVKDEASGYVYVYGRKQIFLEFSIHVGRFPIANPNKTWEFWDGARWQADINKCATIGVGDSPGTSVFKVRDKYVALSTEITFQCDNGRRIFASYSDSPTGPFTPRKEIYTIPDRRNGHTPLFYVPVGHGEYLNSRNEVLITYSINGYEPCVANCVSGRASRDIYLVKSARIPMEMIDPYF